MAEYYLKRSRPICFHGWNTHDNRGLDNHIGYQGVLLMSARFSKRLWTGILFIILGVISYLAEQVFYGYVDENGFLQESLFLPLAFILGFIGLIFLAVGSRKARR